jgi:hypothetical protein
MTARFRYDSWRGLAVYSKKKNPFIPRVLLRCCAIMVAQCQNGLIFFRFLSSFGWQLHMRKLATAGSSLEKQNNAGGLQSQRQDGLEEDRLSSPADLGVFRPIVFREQPGPSLTWGMAHVPVLHFLTGPLADFFS